MYGVNYNYVWENCNLQSIPTLTLFIEFQANFTMIDWFFKIVHPPTVHMHVFLFIARFQQQFLELNVKLYGERQY